MDQLRTVVKTPKKWRRCYSLFQQIRNKTLRADRRGDEYHQHQYCFEEICAKTLYNMSVPPEEYARAYPAPFDDDSAKYVVPIATAFAEYLQIPNFNLNQVLSTYSEHQNTAITIPCTEARLARLSKWMRSWFGLGDG